MRIIHVMECFAGGTFEFLSTLTQEMKENEYIIIHGNRENTPPNYRERFPQGTVFVPWKYAQREINFMTDGRALMELMRYFKEYGEKESVIHLHSSKAGFLGRLAARLMGKSNRVIYTAHGAAFLRLDVSRLKHWLYIFLERIGSWLGGTVVACSHSEGEAFKKYGIQHVVVINNGIKIEANQGSCKKTVGDKIIVGTLARITYQKNPKQFNEIAEEFIDDEGIKFLWIGDGELRHELKSPNIEITGWLEKKEAKKNLDKVNIYLSTSLWEGLPLSALEAMALGKIMVLSDCVGNRDLVNENGYLFRETEEGIKQIKTLLGSKEIRTKYVFRSMKLLREAFLVSSFVEKYKNCYKLSCKM